MSYTQEANRILNAKQRGYFTAKINSFVDFFNHDRNKPLTKDLYIALYIYLTQEHDKKDVIYWMLELVVNEENEWFNTLINDYEAVENYGY